ncbi:MAG: cytidylate kinase family protein [Candidatus Caldatribacterium sp.]|uniref:cytidylate kinase family protein n=1 Tax=Candidatus Caldatribacterium sp. TaxID=2282143 RepID=UPI002994411C|nr:cytidylate kinase family protein [Candidatus Caldatribacterium sp.]MCX7729613.1 cytidylate kinase family protein [Candidatus Caldatribacterium sp.]MDW8081383.1 cytidylate kinase family protein [Candidatus Calescibacterium sp.]
MSNFSVITVSRETESLGDEVASRLARVLGFELVDRGRWIELLQKFSLPPEPPEEDEERGRWMESVSALLTQMAEKRAFVLLGRGGQRLLAQCPRAFHLLIVAPVPLRIRRIMKRYRQDEVTASRILTEQDRQRERFLLHYFGIDWRNPLHYHFILNTAFYDVEESCQLVLEAMRRIRPPSVGYQESFFPEKLTFSHPSEEEFARILDFYGIRWLYEPRVFPLEWDSEGNVIEAFTPDFYLPDFDLFVEITTQKQKLTWRKNRKIRKLKALYPEVKIKVIYARDYEHMLRKFNLQGNHD